MSNEKVPSNPYKVLGHTLTLFKPKNAHSLISLINAGYVYFIVPTTNPVALPVADSLVLEVEKNAEGVERICYRNKNGEVNEFQVYDPAWWIYGLVNQGFTRVTYANYENLCQKLTPPQCYRGVYTNRVQSPVSDKLEVNIDALQFSVEGTIDTRQWTMRMAYIDDQNHHEVQRFNCPQLGQTGIYLDILNHPPQVKADPVTDPDYFTTNTAEKVETPVHARDVPGEPTSLVTRALKAYEAVVTGTTVKLQSGDIVRKRYIGGDHYANEVMVYHGPLSAEQQLQLTRKSDGCMLDCVVMVFTVSDGGEKPLVGFMPMYSGLLEVVAQS